MQVLDLNLASRPLRNNTLYWAGHLAALGLLAWFTVWNVGGYLEASSDLEALRSESSSFESRMTQLDLRERRAQARIEKINLDELSVQAAKANDVIRRKALSWTRLFNQLEQVMPYDVRMVAIRPQFSHQRRLRGRVVQGSSGVRVTVEGRSKGLEPLLELERNLLSDPHFDEVEPERWARMPEGVEIIFTLHFRYFPEGKRGDEAVVTPETEPEPLQADGEAADATVEGSS